MYTNPEILAEAIKIFEASERNAVDYVNFAAIVVSVTQHEPKVRWLDFQKIAEDVLEQPYDVYMKDVDDLLMEYTGRTHTQFPDFLWMDYYADGVLVEIAVTDFLYAIDY